ncbi:MAG TPA: hypothetical protein VF708_14570 [Pyrinomonadaceae bacterium]|jgi:hypothetical protein
MSKNLITKRHASSLLLIPILIALCSAPCLAQKKKKGLRTPAPKVETRTELIAEVDELDTAVWERFTSAEGRFSILFPGVPEEKTQVQEVEGGKLTWHLVQLISARALYQVVVVDYPARLDTPEKIKGMLDAIRVDNLDNNQGQLLGESDVTIEGHPGRYLAWRTKRGMLMKARYFLSGNRSYLLRFGVPENWDSGRPDESPEQTRETLANRFFDSFKISSESKQ